jgi:hypothetical protein
VVSSLDQTTPSDRKQPGSFAKSHEQKAEKKEKKKKKKRKTEQKRPIVHTSGRAIFVSIRHVVLFFFLRHSTQMKKFLRLLIFCRLGLGLGLENEHQKAKYANSLISLL